MAGYVKLFNSILASTIWREPDHVRICWITLLAMSDRHGVAEGSVPGLADFARLSVADTRRALKRLAAPDKDSRSQEHQGRRIRAVEGGWFLLNHGKYRAKLNADDRREYDRKRKAEYRQKQKSHGRPTMSQNVRDLSTVSAHADADAEEESTYPPIGSRGEPPPVAMLTPDLERTLSSIVRNIPEADRRTASAFHQAVEDGLRGLGWTVAREHRIDDRGDGRAGYLDLVVTAPLRLAIELDRLTPRVKSIEKLAAATSLGFLGVAICRDDPAAARWFTQGVVSVFAVPRGKSAPRHSVDAWDQSRKTREAHRLMAEGVSRADALKRAGF
jgi:hypothetical protein